ncbi:lysylphosphatidylglycerol synthase transmembrane domain-containing protein [Streptomyces sp. 351MFTsu5.1]|uniref:lysylphosphatidylglycerol synthase transmembrane domain-containing protein n=1 Tax=Streptomyces sp. 351MFTsu5.1 TaxID=1172180 RepID=UPI00036A8DBD|nr:lysylphosphatidylglycerol synthase transmembrane domain-containing protein [Streptomyces sp. 351MFTsu5.1]
MSLLPLEGPPAPLPSSAPAPAPAGHRRSLSRLTRRVLTLLPVLLIGVWAVLDWRALYDGTARLADADPGWLLVALLWTCLGWVSASVVRQGALPERLPPGLLVASQFAAGAANHVLPASLGAHAVTLRFLRGQGVPLARATASLALYSLVRPIAKTLVLVGFLVTLPGLLRLGELVPDRRMLFLPLAAAGLGLGGILLLLVLVRPLRRPAVTFVRTALTDARLLHTMPSRVLALWGGAAAAPLLQASVIHAVGASLGVTLSWAQVAFAYLAASTAVGSVPAPGGIGPVDAAMVFTLAVYGVPVSVGTAALIGYRVLTVWLPLLPGVLCMSALVHRKVL